MNNLPQKEGRRGTHISNGRVLKEFWRGMKPYRAYFYLCIILLIVGNSINLFAPILYKRFIDTITTSQDPQSSGPILIGILLMILVVQATRWALVQVAIYSNVYFQSMSMAKLRQNSFEYMIDHSYSFFANNFTGSLVQRVGRFARAFERLTDRLLWNVIPIGVYLIGMSIVLWFVSPIITLIIVVWVTVLLVFNYYFSRWKLKYNLKMVEADSRTTGVLSDNITNQNTIQLFTGTQSEVQDFRAVTEDQSKATIKSWNLSSAVDMFQSALVIITEFFLFYFAVRFWQQGRITIGTFVLIQTYFIALSGRLWDFSRIIRDWYEGFADAKEMVDILEEQHEIRDIPTATNLAITNAVVTYNNTTFSFNETREVLKNISLTIKGGEKVALIGPSGAGKSTFVRLLLRLYDVTSGSIEIDGQNIKNITQKSLREHLSLVPQDPILFHRSLKENIRYGKRDATDEEVIEAAKLAHAHEFIKDLPQGYDTLVGERGIKLSGGERQRVAIARALLKNAPILILDEATSSLDSESEHLIQDALETLMRGKTVIVIAHRLSTISKMDRIVVLEDGAVREEGTHDSLLHQEGSLYKKLWELQAGGFIPV
jgi:ATP-binding cassette subfamily B protein